MRKKGGQKNKNNTQKISQLKMILAGIGSGLLLTLSILIIAFLAKYKNRIYPHIYIDSISVDGLTREETLAKISTVDAISPTFNLTVTADKISISSSSAQLGWQQQQSMAVSQAFNLGRTANLWQNFKTLLQLFHQPARLSSTATFDSEKISTLIKILAEQVDSPATPPQARLGYSGSAKSIIIDAGTYGRQIDQGQAVTQVSHATTPQDQNLEISVASVGARLETEQIESARQKAARLVGQKAKLTYDNTAIYLNDQELVSLLGLPSGLNLQASQDLISKWTKIINRAPQNAEFEYDPQTLVVKKFIPHRDGLKLDEEKTLAQLQELLDQMLEQNEQKLLLTKQLTVTTTKPNQSLGQTNNLGIQELIGFGESYYAHSIPSRIHNVALTTDKINNFIVKPGAEFSFNQALGDVSSSTGYRPAYVIKEGKTVLGDGGGVCQVSSTLFRALLNAGLNITKRKPHSYRVSYYELNSDPGFDATVYDGDIDLRFINDTNNYLIIHGETDSNRLWMKMEIYGTADGRRVEIGDYKKWGYQPPLATQYIPDPSLPTGRLKQIDWSAAGINASFVYTVKDKNGKLMWQKTFESHYQPWAAKYLRGV